jgi:hypothetical protein
MAESPNPELAIELWYRYLNDEPKDLVQAAFDKYIAENKFPPKPAEILERIEMEKCRIWNDWMFEDSMYVHGDGEKPKPIPEAYLPRSIYRAPKQFELANERRIAKNLAGFDRIGVLPE